MYRKRSQTAVDILLHFMELFTFIFSVYLATLTNQAFDWGNTGTARKSGSEWPVSESRFQFETFRILSRNDSHSSQMLGIILFNLFPLVHLQIIL